MARVPLRALHGRVEGPCHRNQNDAPAATRTWWHTAMPLPPSFWKCRVRNGGGLCRAFFAMLPDLAVRRDTRIAVNCDRSWRQSRTQPLSAGAAAKGGPSTWVVMQRTYATRKPLTDHGPPGCLISLKFRNRWKLFSGWAANMRCYL